MGGTEIGVHCGNCGNRNEISDRYCVACGFALEFGSAREAVAVREPGRATVHWGAVEVVASVFIALGVLVAASVAAAQLASVFHPQGKALAVWATVHLTALGIVAIVWLLGVRRSQSPLTALGLGRSKMGTLLDTRVVFQTAAVVAASLAVGAGYGLLIEWSGPDILLPDPLDPAILFDGPAIALSWEALAVVTPLSEEIFFRGFVFAGLLPRFGPRWAIAASALLFCAFHLSVALIIPIFITGALLAWLYWRTGSLWPCVVAHAVQNTVAVGAALL